MDYVVALGTTGESTTLTKEEKKSVVACIAQATEGKAAVVLGLGGNNTAELLAYLDYFDFSNVSGILSVTPYYNKPTQEGLIAHYKMFADHAPRPVILYNVPGRTAVNLLPQSVLVLANEAPNIVGIKEASGILGQAMEIIADKPRGFAVLSGDDNLNYPILALGGDGVISVSANAFPKYVTEMVTLVQNGHFAQAKDLHFKLYRLTNALFEEGNPAGIKALLNSLKYCEKDVRLPLLQASAHLQDKINRLAADLLL